jgi:hypothetical protein
MEEEEEDVLASAAITLIFSAQCIFYVWSMNTS